MIGKKEDRQKHREWRKNFKEWQTAWKNEWRKETGNRSGEPYYRTLRVLERLLPLIWLAFLAFVGYLAYQYIPIARLIFDDIFLFSKNLIDDIVGKISSYL
ncbi:MAG TPA: hypothetical protein VJI33_03325 [Candidatus Paceibacterota bacterium]